MGVAPVSGNLWTRGFATKPGLRIAQLTPCCVGGRLHRSRRPGSHRAQPPARCPQAASRWRRLPARTSAPPEPLAAALAPARPTPGQPATPEATALCRRAGRASRHPALAAVVPLEHQYLAVDGMHHLLVLHHLAEDLGLDAGLPGQAHHLDHRTDVAAGEAGVVAVGGLVQARLGVAEAMASGYISTGG